MEVGVAVASVVQVQVQAGLAQKMEVEFVAMLQWQH